MIKLAIEEDPNDQQPHWAQGGRFSQFRVLYREFLFRVVDLELLSAHAGASMDKLLGQFAALLIFLSLLFSFNSLLGFDDRMPPEALLWIDYCDTRKSATNGSTLQLQIA